MSKISLISANIPILLHEDEKEWKSMRKAGVLAKKVLDHIASFITPGISTNEINDLCHNLIIQNGAIPAPLNYKGFPKSICTSINHVVCHGIPNERTLADGDIINVDVTVILEGWHGDTNKTFLVGSPEKHVKAARLIQITYEALQKGIESVKPGKKLNVIGRSIQEYAESQGYSVVRDYCGHGIGQLFHTHPNVPHYYESDLEVVIEPGMFFTIEPMINAGKHSTKTLHDGWTVVTRDKSLSAQFEHTIGVTETGVTIFTA